MPESLAKCIFYKQKLGCITLFGAMRKWKLISVCALLSLWPVAQAVHGVQEFKQLQATIQEVVKRVQPVTVALTSARSGSSGSGVVINHEGLIMTAAHVVERDAEMQVIFPDGKAYKGKVLGANFNKDIALVQLPQDRDWKFAHLGDVNALAIGEDVIVMGHAGGYDSLRKPPVRFGQLLSKNPRGFVTTNCTMIGGDSGGPLFNLKGEVVGINSSIGASSVSVNNHAGVRDLAQDWPRLLKGERWGKLVTHSLLDPDRPMMGFHFRQLRNGAIQVLSVEPGGPAMRAGVRRGDFLLAVGGYKIPDGAGLVRAMSAYRAGDRVKLQIQRGRRVFDTICELKSLKEMYPNVR